MKKEGQSYVSRVLTLTRMFPTCLSLLYGLKNSASSVAEFLAAADEVNMRKTNKRRLHVKNVSNQEYYYHIAFYHTSVIVLLLH